MLKRPIFAQYQEFTTKAGVVLANIEMKATRYKPEVTLYIISDDVNAYHRSGETEQKAGHGYDACHRVHDVLVDGRGMALGDVCGEPTFRMGIRHPLKISAALLRLSEKWA